jgi:hypothetical protein
MGASAAAGLMALGGALGGGAQKAAGEATQRLDNFNADISDQQASDALSRGGTAMNQRRLKERQTIGSQRARLAAQGLDVNSGSAANIQSDTYAIGEMDALTIANNAAREAWGYKVKATDYRMRGEIAKQEGKNKQVGTYLNAGAKIFGASGD